jgi:putative SOS response-associated peptidase YedK
MCGRFTLQLTPAELHEFFTLFRPIDFPPRYNIAPTQPVIAIRDNGHGQRVADWFRWGLIPSWATDASIGSRLINARSETVADKPAFRRAFRSQRCLVPASGFYEWQAVGRSKQPWYLSLKSAEPLALAGLWETWTAPSGETVRTCTILTTAANSFLSELHERMPVILDRDDWPLWLDPEDQPAELLPSLLVPSPAEIWQKLAVKPLVNQVSYEGPECLQPADGTAADARSSETTHTSSHRRHQPRSLFPDE